MCVQEIDRGNEIVQKRVSARDRVRESESVCVRERERERELAKLTFLSL